jgi:aspartate aminotransferase
MTSIFDHVDEAPLDPIFKLKAAYQQDLAPTKVDLGIGAYRDDDGKPWILPVVREAEKMLAEDLTINYEYLSIEGLKLFTDAAMKLVLGDTTALHQKHVFTIQTLSGTGALRLTAEFLHKYWIGERTVYGPTPSWINHSNVFSSVGLSYKTYRYLNVNTKSLDLDGLLEDLKVKKKKSITRDVIVHRQ